jgi:hypothetical protein
MIYDAMICLLCPCLSQVVLGWVWSLPEGQHNTDPQSGGQGQSPEVDLILHLSI